MTTPTDDDLEAYLLLLLSDANLPTGSFVASAGLESYIKHGFFGLSDLPTSQPFDQALAQTQPPKLAVGTINFLRDSVQSYARTALPFIRAVHETMENISEAESALNEILRLDELYESMTLNHVSRRASKAQGVALLTLYTKGFSKPSWIPEPSTELGQFSSKRNDKLVDRFKILIRKGDTPGHLPICWAVLVASLGLSRGRSQQLHIFLHARALLSASVRLNTIGPYAAQQMLLHIVKPLVADAVESCKDLSIRLEEADELDENVEGPACTWPLGEILSSRHDQQHSRIFNS